MSANEIQDNDRWCDAVVTLTGCDRDDAVEALRQMANTLVGSPCPLSAARRRVIDRLEVDGCPTDWSGRLTNAVNYVLSFR